LITVGGAHPAVTVVLVVDDPVVGEVDSRVVDVVARDGASAVGGVVGVEDGSELSGPGMVVGEVPSSGEVAATWVPGPSARGLVITMTAPTTSATEIRPAIHRYFDERSRPAWRFAAISGSSMSFRLSTVTERN
jgi:hypothetical protein